MIEYLKENYLWIGVLASVAAAIIGLVPVFIKKSGRTQKIKNITGDNNIVVNGDISVKKQKGKQSD